MTEWIAVTIAALALLISGITAWLSLFRGGKLRMTQPTVIFFGPDGSSPGERHAPLKVFLRTLLYSTSQRGQIVESMHINVQRGESKQNFSVWIYGDPPNLARGSGLYVGREGVVCNHHFLLLRDGTKFDLLAGHYTVRVFGKRVVDREARELAAIQVTISESQAQVLREADAGIYFDWGPDQQAYQSHVELRPPELLPPWLSKLMPSKDAEQRPEPAQSL